MKCYRLIAAVLAFAWGASEVEAAVDAPSLTDGAIITITGGQKQTRRSRRRQQPREQDLSLRLVVRETVKTGTLECYMEDCGLRMTTCDTYDQIHNLLYYRSGPYAEILFDAWTFTGRTFLSDYMRGSVRKSDDLERGGGTAATMRFQRKEGNVYSGVFNGVFFRPDTDSVYYFRNAPLTVEVPEPGTKLPDPEPVPELQPVLPPSQE